MEGELGGEGRDVTAAGLALQGFPIFDPKEGSLTLHEYVRQSREGSCRILKRTGHNSRRYYIGIYLTFKHLSRKTVNTKDGHRKFLRLCCLSLKCRLFTARLRTLNLRGKDKLNSNSFVG